MVMAGKRWQFAAWLLLAAGLSLAGCVVPADKPVPAPAAATQPPRIDPALELLRYTHTVGAASPAERVQMLADARAAAQRLQSPENLARLALTYGQPGYTGYAPANGERYAKKALATGENYWSDNAAAYLKQYAELCADNDQVRQALAAERKTADTLGDRLAQARQKLRAITDIETEITRPRR